LERSNPRRKERGAALPLAIILLGVLTVIAVTAVSLSTQERTAAAAYSNLDAIYACANAGVGKLWREIAVSGTQYASSTDLITYIVLPDGTKLTAPAHYDTAATATVKSVVSAETGNADGTQPETDMTNKGLPTVKVGQTQIFSVTCQDANGRILEVEVGLRFAL
jgi:Tfp pilus assembly protein PilX